MKKGETTNKNANVAVLLENEMMVLEIVLHYENPSYGET